MISPEGCASILWRDGDQSKTIAAEALRLTAQDLLGFGVIDEIVPEPLGGAHRDPQAAMTAVGDAIEKTLKSFNGIDGEALRLRRRDKFLEMGRKGIP